MLQFGKASGDSQESRGGENHINTNNNYGWLNHGLTWNLFSGIHLLLPSKEFLPSAWIPLAAGACFPFAPFSSGLSLG